MLANLNFFAQSRLEPIDKEWFFASAGASYSVENMVPGVNLRLGLPMQRGFNFVAQGTYFAPFKGNKTTEFRYGFNVELTLFKYKNVSSYTSAGLSFGYWTRESDNLFVHPPERYRKNESIMFGGGIAYHLPRSQFYLDYKNYPQIFSSYFSLGWTFKFFENKQLRDEYYDFLKKKRFKQEAAQ